MKNVYESKSSQGIEKSTGRKAQAMMAAEHNTSSRKADSWIGVPFNAVNYLLFSQYTSLFFCPTYWST
jgi:hypothetical protein